MKIMLMLLLGLPAGPAAAQDEDLEAKKKQLGELLQKFSLLQVEIQKLLEELTDGDPAKQMALIEEVAKKYAPAMKLGMVRAQRAANERNASSTLKTFATGQADFRANDRDQNRVNDFWVADISGLYRILIPPGEAEQEPIRLIERSAAEADARPVVPLDKTGKLGKAEGFDASSFGAIGKPSPKAGYWFVVMKYYVDHTGAKKAYDKGNGRAHARFGIVAYPAEYGKTGNRTFIINEANTIFWKDTEGKPVEAFPADYRKEGWSKLD